MPADDDEILIAADYLEEKGICLEVVKELRAGVLQMGARAVLIEKCLALFRMARTEADHERYGLMKHLPPADRTAIIGYLVRYSDRPSPLTPSSLRDSSSSSPDVPPAFPSA